MKKRPTRSLPLLLLASVLIACEKNAAPEPEANELITTVTLTFTERGTTNVRTVTWRDADGEEGTAPTIGKLILAPNKTYDLTVQMRDESKSPAADITEEIGEKADEHLFVYTPTPANLLTVTITDKDARNLPVGLKATATTGAAGTGKLQVVLRHQPPVGGNPVKNGTPGPGSTDFDGTFDLEIR